MCSWCVGWDDTEVQIVGSRRPRYYHNRLHGSQELVGRMSYRKEDTGSLGPYTIWDTTGNEGTGYCCEMQSGEGTRTRGPARDIECDR